MKSLHEKPPANQQFDGSKGYLIASFLVHNTGNGGYTI